MSRWRISLRVLGPLCVLAACSTPPRPPLVAQTSGTFETAVSSPVQIVRDRWGVPHISALSLEDLFFAQGVVQAEDRLFQMDLWRRAAQGRLSEILGPSFIERDGMTRRMQYAGDIDAEWASYGPDAKAIASAFVRGVNAWVARAQERLPEAFVLAGWRPECWSPLDLLNRTDAFVASGDAIDEVARRQLSPVVADAIRRVGTRPFLAGSRTPPGVVLDNPSPRYLVHLRAPGWNVIGVTAPWRPGVAAGHNGRIAWDVQPAPFDTQDVFVLPADAPAWIIDDAIRVKGRASPFVFRRELTARGVVIAADRERHQVYTLRWSGFEPGGASELGALALDRAQSAVEFRAALAYWKMPARRVTYSETGADRRFQDAALVPIRKGDDWAGWKTIDDLPHGSAPATSSEQRATAGAVVFAHVLATTEALRQRLNVGPLTSAKPVERYPVLPGQSESPSSPHFGDLARMWSAGQELPLAFSEDAIRASAESTLTLIPKK